MKKRYIFNVLFLAAFAQSVWAMEEKEVTVEQDNKPFDIHQDKETNKTYLNMISNVLEKTKRKVKKGTGLFTVASESTEELNQRLEAVGRLESLKSLSEDAKQGGLLSINPSVYRQVNDRLYEFTRQAQISLVDMYDNNSLDIGKLNIAKKYIDNSKACFEALHKVLDNCYSEKFQEITKSIENSSNNHQIIENNNNNN